MTMTAWTPTPYHVLLFCVGMLMLMLWLTRDRRPPRPPASNASLDLLEWWLIDRIKIWQENHVDAAEIGILELVLVQVQAIRNAGRRDDPEK